MKHIYAISLAFLMLSACTVDDKIQELSASYSGQIIDKDTGSPLLLEYNSAALLFGDNGYDPTQPVVFYVKPDGSFTNTGMMPGNYEISARGPFVKVDTLHSYSLSGRCDFDIKAVPNVRLDAVKVDVAANGRCKMTVDYKVLHETTFGEMSIVWGKNQYPGALTAATDTEDSRASSWQKKYTFSGTDGSVSLNTGVLTAGLTYYVRVGSRVSGTDYWNYSQQYKVTSQGVVE